MTAMPNPRPPHTQDRLLLYVAGPQATGPSPFAASKLPRRTVENLDQLTSEAAQGVGAVVVLSDGLDEASLGKLAERVARTPCLQETQIYIASRTPEGDERPVPPELAQRGNVGLFDSSTPDQALCKAVEAGVREQQRQAYLEEVLESLEAVEKREERLLALIGHELRNPLAVLATSISVLRRRESENETLARQLSTMERQVKALTDKIDEMLHTSREERREEAPGIDPSHASHDHTGLGNANSLMPEDYEAPPEAKGRTLLVVEDHDEGRALLVELLQLWGYQVEAAADGREGIDKARQVNPPVALVDIDLPKIDGHEIARTLRAEEGAEKLHLIAMSGFGQQEDRLRSMAAGFDQHLVKPVDPVRLANLLHGVFRPNG